MAKAYTPGLKVAAHGTYRSRRLLPIKGEVLVKAGDRVTPSTPVARTYLEGEATPMKLANLLGAQPRELPSLMLKPVGSRVAVGEPIARSKGIFGMMKTEVKSAAEGTIESVSETTGMAIIRGEPIPVQVDGYIAGSVVEVIDGEGVVVEAQAAVVQGIFGVSGEASGPIKVVCAAPTEVCDTDHIDASCQGCVVVGGARMTAAAIKKAKDMGAAALVSGGLDDSDLRDFLGYDLGVAITGTEKTGLTVIVTEGFGDIAMADRTYHLLKGLEGRLASVNGATQIRAGVMRPEIVVPLDAAGVAAAKAAVAARLAASVAHEEGSLEIGVQVRIIRDPHFGVIGTVAALPEAPAVLGSGSKARVLDVKLQDGSVVTIPRANVELIEG